MCFVRQRTGDHMELTTYGRSSGFALDPIEKKPLNHFYPGTSVLSFGTAGCNLACKFCQNWDISKSREMDRLTDEASPEAIARAAKRGGAASIAFTYNDPTIFAEYAMDVADACHALGLHTVAVTAGYIHAEPRRELYAHIDAANVDLKAFTDEFYWKQAAAHLEPVKETLRYLVRETTVWTEITTLLIPGLNDSDAELHELSAWVARDLGPDVPLHFTAFHPDYKLMDIPATPPATLQRARAIAIKRGLLRYVYTGNVHDREGGTTRAARPLQDRGDRARLVRDPGDPARSRDVRRVRCADPGQVRRFDRTLRAQADARGGVTLVGSPRMAKKQPTKKSTKPATKKKAAAKKPATKKAAVKKPAAKKAAPKPAAKKAAPKPAATPKLVPSIAQLAAVAMAGDLPKLMGLMNNIPEDDRDQTAYKWLAVASDFGNEDAEDVMGDLLEATSLRFDDDQLLTGNAHWELGVAYLTGTDGLPRDLEKAAAQLASAHERGSPMSVQESDAMLASTRARLAPDALAVFDAVYGGESLGRLDDRAGEGADEEEDDDEP